jgi:hypothetical protein
VYRLWKCTLVKHGAVCSFAQNASTGLADGPWVRTTHVPAGANVIGRAVDIASVFPPAEFAVNYYRTCSGEPTRDCATDAAWSNDGLACPQFCSYLELKAWLEPFYSIAFNARVAGTLDRIDTLLYDLKYAVDLLDTTANYALPAVPDDEEMQYGDAVVDFFGLDDTGNPLRLDTCQCEWLLRCPNGTASAPGSTSIYNCSVSQRTVLQRIVPIPQWQFPFEYATSYTGTHVVASQLSDYWNPVSHVGFIPLLAWETAVITLNMSLLAPNLTYFEDYQFSVYENADSCTPCPAMYQCQYILSSLSWTCSNLLPVGLADAATCSHCCKCQRVPMPAWFETFDPVANEMVSGNTVPTDASSPFWPAFDNKHVPVQVSFLALQNTSLYFCVELLHGQYYTEFQRGFSNMAGAQYRRCRSAAAALCDGQLFVACRYCDTPAIARMDRAERPLLLHGDFGHDQFPESREFAAAQPANVISGGNYDASDHIQAVV